MTTMSAPLFEAEDQVADTNELPSEGSTTCARVLSGTVRSSTGT